MTIFWWGNKTMRLPIAAVLLSLTILLPGAASGQVTYPTNPVSLLIAFPPAKPGRLNCASRGPGAGAHPAAGLFKAEAKGDIGHVPYKGAAPALPDVVAGHVQIMFAPAASVVPHIQSGKVRALAVT